MYAAVSCETLNISREGISRAFLWGYSLEVTDRRTYRTEGCSFWSDWSGWTDRDREQSGMIQSEPHRESRIAGTRLEGNDTSKPRKSASTKQEVHEERERAWNRTGETMGRDFPADRRRRVGQQTSDSITALRNCLSSVFIVRCTQNLICFTFGWQSQSTYSFQSWPANTGLATKKKKYTIRISWWALLR